MSLDNDAEMLKAARESARLTDKEAAKSLNISLTTLWRMETGRRKPRLDLLKRMAKTYRVGPKGITNWED